MSERFKTHRQGVWPIVFMLLVYLFLYMPILVVVMYSFNQNSSNMTFQGFTLRWYSEVLHGSTLWANLFLSLKLALVATIISVVLGTLATIGTYRYEFRLKKYLNAMLYIPLVIPELVIGLASLAAFSRMGMKMGKLTEAALNVEGYQSSGKANVYKNNITIGGSSSDGSNAGNPGNENAGNNLVKVADADKIQCEAMTKGGQYTGDVSSPFDGVILYANDDSVKFTQNFTKNTHDFTLRGCSNNGNMARVDLKIGGQNKGTFYFGDANPAEYTIKNVSHGVGEQTVELVVTADDGQWDANIDWLGIGGISTEGKNNEGSQDNPGQSAGADTNKIECEKMTKNGQYTGYISDPFNGVALYANNDSVKFSKYFAYGSHDFTLRGCSNNDNMARVDLKIGGQNKGTFYFGDAYPITTDHGKLMITKQFIKSWL